MKKLYGCSGLFTSFLKSISDSRTEDGCIALFFIAVFHNFGVRVIIKLFVFL